MPSTVVISGPSCSSATQLIASMVQLRVGTPSTSTVHAPHDESSHPRLDPVKSNSWRRTSSSSSLDSIASSCLRPFTRSSMSSFFIGSKIPSAARDLYSLVASEVHASDLRVASSLLYDLPSAPIAVNCLFRINRSPQILKVLMAIGLPRFARDFRKPQYP